MAKNEIGLLETLFIEKHKKSIHFRIGTQNLNKSSLVSSDGLIKYRSLPHLFHIEM